MNSIYQIFKKHIDRLHQQHPGLAVIINNVGWLSVDQAIRMVGTLFVGVWIARYLGPSRYGQLNYALALVALVASPASLGLDDITVKHLVAKRFSHAEILGSTFILRFAAGCFAYLLICFYALESVHDKEMRILLSIIGICAVTQAFNNIALLFRANSSSKQIVQTRNFSFLLTTCIRIVMISENRPLIEFAWMIVAELLLTSFLWCAVYTRLVGPILKWRFNTPLALNLLKQSWPILLSVIAATIYTRIDVVMLEAFTTKTEVGIYAAAVRISEVCYCIPAILASALFPAIVRSRDKGEVLYFRRLQHVFNINSLLAYLVTIGITLFSSQIVNILYGSGFSKAAQILTIHIWASIFLFLGVAAGMFLINEGLTVFTFISTSAGAIVNILLNLALIPHFGGVGAAVSTVVSYAVAAVLCCFAYQKTRRLGFMQLHAITHPLSAFRIPRAPDDDL